MVQTEDIQIANIQEELTNLANDGREGNRPKACLFNLVMYAPEQRNIEYLKGIMNAAAEKFPCRIVFIQQHSEGEEENFLHVSVSNMTRGSGETAFACDYIEINTSMSQLNRVPFIILPSLVPDIPIYLIWGGDPTADKVILPQLQEYGTRLIFDSDNIDNLPKFSRSVLTMIKSLVTLETTDLNWILLADWRNIIAKVFNSADAIQKIQFNKGIQIRFNDKPDSELKHADRQAVYLAWWLATQLNWSYRKEEIVQGRKQLTFHNGEYEFIITLWPETHDDLHTGTVVGFEAASKDDHFYFIAPLKDLAKVTVHVSTLDTCDLPFTLPAPSLKRGSPSITDICYGQINEHYQNMLIKLSSQI